ncbi:MAG: hypothetical protein HY848_09210 [Betaproteobacteria bacterium]|nr:hypothetical protein [Betaproteobacteria bacterium]
MSFRHSITIVASPRPRVGKTLVARLLTEFHRHEGRPVTAFDVNSGEGTLAQFLPEYAKVSEVGDIKGQMALFDRLIADDGATKIVDLGYQQFESFVTVASRIGFDAEARKRGIAPAILFTIAPDRTSVEAYRGLRSRLPQAVMVPLLNELLGPSLHRDKYPMLGGGAALVRVPVLAQGLRRYIDKPPFSFSDSRLANASDIPLDVQIELQRWLRKIYLEFRELELRILLADLQSSIRL